MEKKELMKQARMVKAACVLFFIAAALNAVSVLLRYLGEGQIRWSGLVIALVCVAFGITFSKSQSGGKKRLHVP